MTIAPDPEAPLEPLDPDLPGEDPGVPDVPEPATDPDTAPAAV